MKHRRGIDLVSERTRYIQLETPEFEWETFESLPQWIELFACCDKCGVERYIDRRALARKWGKSTYIKSLTPRLYCTSCDVRGRSRFWLYKVPR